MRIYQQAGCVFWLVLAVLVMTASSRLGLGTMRVPGSGFITFVASLGLAALSVLQLSRVTFGDPDVHGDVDPPLSELWKVVPSFAVLVAYALVLPEIGYGFATFGLMAVLFWLAQPHRPFAVLIAAFLATAVTQILFQVLLKSQFPVGPLGF